MQGRMNCRPLAFDPSKESLKPKYESAIKIQPEKLIQICELQTLIAPLHQAYYIKFFSGQASHTWAPSISLPATDSENIYNDLQEENEDDDDVMPKWWV